RLRRHLSRGEPGQNAVPAGKILNHRLGRGVLPQIQQRGGLRSAVAARAVRLEERPNGFCESACWICVGRSRRVHRHSDAVKEKQRGKKTTKQHGGERTFFPGGRICRVYGSF